MTTPARRNLPSLSIRRPVGTLALASVVVVLGLVHLDRLPLDLLPQIIYPQVRASVNYPGVAPEIMEEQVTRVLETALATTENLVRIESETAEGRASVDLHFRYGTDVNFALQDASKNLDRARARLPRDAEPPTIFKFDPSQIPVFEGAFSSASRSLVNLRDWVDLRLRPQLLTIEGVASVDVAGGLVREIRVTLDQERLRSYGLTVSQVLDALRDENQDVAVGNVTSRAYEIGGKTEGRFRTVEDIRGVLLDARGSGQRVPLSDVATVSDTSREQRIWARMDGVPAVRLSIRKQPDANTVVVASEVRRRIEQLRESHFIPADVGFEVLSDQSYFVRNAVRAVRDAAALGGTLAMLVVLLFLGSLRKTFIVGLAIPLAVLATFVMMGRSGLTLNIMTLGGLALGVGMLVDNAIVMLENIFRHRSATRDATEAAHEGAAEVTSAVVASTLTNLAAVVPFLLISGLAALIFRELILTISFAIVASLAVALTLVPTLSAQLAKVRRSSGLDTTRPIRAFAALLERARQGYRGLAGRLVRRPATVLAVAFAALVAVGLATRGIGSQFLPPVDDGQVSVRFTLAPGTSPQRTNEVAGWLEDAVRRMPAVRHVFVTAGGFFFGSGTSERAGRGSIDVQLAPLAERADMPAARWVTLMQAMIDSLAIPGARITVRPPRIRGLRTNVTGSDVAVSVQGDNLDTLEALGGEVLRRLERIPGLTSLQPSTEEASPQLKIKVDRQRAADLGLSAAAVGLTVRTALDGAIPTRFTDGPNEYDIRVRLPRERFTSPEDVGAVALFAGRERPVYLRDVADVTLGLGPSSILRAQQNRQLRVTGDVNTDVTTVGEAAREARARLADFTLPAGYGLIYGGEEEAIRENSRNLRVVVLLAVFLVFVVMAVQYESLANPLVILVSVPLALIGVGLALLVTGIPASAPVLLGIILLAGIVVNNAILLVEYVELERARGRPTMEAVVEAGVVRLRPILMTTLTTVLGMLPLAIGIGEGAELMRPLAVTVVGGLSVAALLTLFVIPCSYLVVDGVASRLRGWLLGIPVPQRAAAPGD